MNHSHDTDNCPASNATDRKSTGARFAGWTILNACMLGIGVWLIATSGSNPMMQRAHAGPPAPSALSIEQRAASGNDVLLDAGAQQAEIISQLRSLRQEVAEMKAAMLSGRVRTEVTNLNDLKLEIDYAKLRDASRGQ